MSRKPETESDPKIALTNCCCSANVDVWLSVVGLGLAQETAMGSVGRGLCQWLCGSLCVGGPEARQAARGRGQAGTYFWSILICCCYYHAVREWQASSTHPPRKVAGFDCCVSGYGHTDDELTSGFSFD